MSTVKIKTEPATEPTTAAATTAIDVKVKLEPSLSTGDIKLEQHSSDVDTKVESDSEADSEEDEEGDIKSESDDEDSGDTDQLQASTASKRRGLFICNHLGCCRRFNYANNMRMHQHEHKLQTDISIFGKTYTLTRQSLNDRWPCPVPDCKVTFITVNSASSHVRKTHINTVIRQQLQPPSQTTRYKRYFLDVDEFYVNDVRCGYHNTTGVFICHECKLVPDCLLAHLQQKHAFDEKSIDNSVLPESAVNASANPNVNQHTSNQLLASAISQPYRQYQHGIVPGWLCAISNCGYCGYTALNKEYHKRSKHQGEQISTVPALVLRLMFAKIQTSCFLITRLDQKSGAVANTSNRMNQHKLNYSHSGLNTQDENGNDTSQNETTDTSNQKQQWQCEYNGCRRLFNSPRQLYTHRREHALEFITTVQGTRFTLSRQSVDDRWPCPVPDCEITCKTIEITYKHIRADHATSIKQKRANSDEDNTLQQPIIKRPQRTDHYINVDDVYVGRTRCGYHKTTGVFLCHECRLVPQCLLTHLQQKHGYDGKSINNSALPQSAVNASANPNVNQHTSNPYLTSAINNSHWQQHQDIVQGWLCVTSDCVYCFTKEAMDKHQYNKHRGEQLSSVPALVLRLLFAKSKTLCFLITRLDTITDCAESNNSTIQQKNESDYDDGDELVLSDYSD